MNTGKQEKTVDQKIEELTEQIKKQSSQTVLDFIDQVFDELEREERELNSEEETKGEKE